MQRRDHHPPLPDCELRPRLPVGGLHHRNRAGAGRHAARVRLVERDAVGQAQARDDVVEGAGRTGQAELGEVDVGGVDETGAQPDASEPDPAPALALPEVVFAVADRAGVAGRAEAPARTIEDWRQPLSGGQRGHDDLERRSRRIEPLDRTVQERGVRHVVLDLAGQAWVEGRHAEQHLDGAVVRAHDDYGPLLPLHEVMRLALQARVDRQAQIAALGLVGSHEVAPEARELVARRAADPAQHQVAGALHARQAILHVEVADDMRGDRPQWIAPVPRLPRLGIVERQHRAAAVEDRAAPHEAGGARVVGPHEPHEADVAGAEELPVELCRQDAAPGGQGQKGQQRKPGRAPARRAAAAEDQPEGRDDEGGKERDPQHQHGGAGLRSVEPVGDRVEQARPPCRTHMAPDPA